METTKLRTLNFHVMVMFPFTIQNELSAAGQELLLPRNYTVHYHITPVFYSQCLTLRLAVAALKRIVARAGAEIWRSTS